MNGHAHAKVYSPDKFIGVATGLVKTKVFKGIIDWINPLDNILPMFFEKDELSRLKTFLDYENKTEEEVIDELVNSTDGIVCVKIIDLSCMGAGNVQKTLLEQLIDLIKLKETYPQLQLFPVLDPRNKDLNEIIRYLYLFSDKIAGFGLYPNIGYTADDIRLYDAWHWANYYGKAVMIHTSDTTPVYYKDKGLEKLLQPIKKRSWYVEKKTRREKCAMFCHPCFGIEMAQRYPNVNVSFCHAGGDNLSNRDIIDAYATLRKNVYFDISATVQNVEQFENFLSSITSKGKLIVGNDHYMDTTWNQKNFDNIAKSYEQNLLNFLRL